MTNRGTSHVSLFGTRILEDDAQMKTIIEPFRIKSVEPIHLTTIEEREALLEEAGFNLFKLPAERVIIDLLTDSGTGAMSSEQWAGIMRGDESYAGSKSYQRFEDAVKDIFGFSHVIPTHQGRAAEFILANILCKPGDVVPNNTHFDTTRANIEATGATAIDIPCSAAANMAVPDPFKGNIDLAALERVLQENEGNVPFAMITVTNNGGGGQPVSLDNIRQTAKICNRHNVPFYIDACRFGENAWFIKTRDPQQADKAPIEIAREMFALSDGCTMSAKKDGMANIGGFLCSNDEELAQRERQLLILTEGFPTYGGLTGRDLDAIAVGLYEALDEDYLKYRTASTEFLGQRLTEAGVPIMQPPGGHAIYIAAKAGLPHIEPLQYPAQALSVEIYRHSGIRTVEVGSVMMGRRDESGAELPAEHELVRLAIPRRTYTQSHIEYVVEAITEVFKNRDSIRGMEVVEQPKALRHFSARFRPLGR